MKNGAHQISEGVVELELDCFTDKRGSLTPIECADLPIDVVRIYFIHDIAEDISRGNHAHYRTNQILIAVQGKITIVCSDNEGKREYHLSSPKRGLVVPAGVWTTNYHSKGSVMCVLADSVYDERDYIDDRTVFKRWKRCQPFHGCFSSFEELADVDSLENDEWLNYQLAELDKISCEPDPQLLAVVEDGMRILDFGGSLGHCYHRLVNTGKFNSIEYHVVETPLVVDAGNRLFASDSKLFFHDELPDLQVVDIVYSRTALQYVSDWRGVLDRLASYGAEYLVLSDTQAGNIPTFVGMQNWYGHFVPNWFFNLDELVAEVPGYDLESVAKGMPVNMSNYHKAKRLHHACHLKFKRRESWSPVVSDT